MSWTSMLLNQSVLKAVVLRTTACEPSWQLVWGGVSIDGSPKLKVTSGPIKATAVLLTRTDIYRCLSRSF